MERRGESSYGLGRSVTATQARCVKEARRKVMQGELRSGRQGAMRRDSVRLGSVGKERCGVSRQAWHDWEWSVKVRNGE